MLTNKEHIILICQTHPPLRCRLIEPCAAYVIQPRTFSTPCFPVVYTRFDLHLLLQLELHGGGAADSAGSGGGHGGGQSAWAAALDRIAAALEGAIGQLPEAISATRRQSSLAH